MVYLPECPLLAFKVSGIKYDDQIFYVKILVPDTSLKESIYGKEYKAVCLQNAIGNNEIQLRELQLNNEGKLK